MSHTEWLPLWEDDEQRFVAYSEVSLDVQEQMRKEYREYIQQTYPIGAIAVEAETELS